jgi:predicted NAD-dependent protein-ADP-ribosyltransferase YbiA (DUF1768 family)
MLNPTYRTLDDGERIEGTWRPIFINNGGTYFQTDLKIYADGLIDCWGLVDLDGLRNKVRTGWVATRIPEGGQASAHLLGAWKFAEPRFIDGDELILEVADTLAELQGAPSSSDRCLEALNSYLADRSEERRLTLRDAYLEIPTQMRRFVLGDQDMEDWPVRVLIGELGDNLMPRTPPFEERPITDEDRASAFRYFERERTRRDSWRAKTNDGDPDGLPDADSLPSVGEGGYTGVKGGGWVDMAGHGYLANDVPTPVRVDGVEYPSVTHAYWALSTDDSEAQASIRSAAKATDAKTLGIAAPRKADWPFIRLAVMTDLVRLKFRQHPDLAEKLVATGAARIRAPGFAGRYWDGYGNGRNWLGRILELVRSELARDTQS